MRDVKHGLPLPRSIERDEAYTRYDAGTETLHC
jgi:hypothetical protein